MNTISRFMNDESGATAIEYGLIAAIVGVGIIVGLQNLKTGLNSTFNGIQSQLNTANGAGGGAGGGTTP
ncbi:MAG TPA: Flp family type IVb pilin [Hyphomicrobium sp.]|jgi:pilus assembly protein Flp/PilA|nr:Flp family type IVb pilin [Hyphomicrobium sp.]